MSAATWAGDPTASSEPHGSPDVWPTDREGARVQRRAEDVRRVEGSVTALNPDVLQDIHGPVAVDGDDVASVSEYMMVEGIVAQRPPAISIL
jgi:hypothetical protein